MRFTIWPRIQPVGFPYDSTMRANCAIMPQYLFEELSRLVFGTELICYIAEIHMFTSI